MHIDRGQALAGYPLLVLRRLFRRHDAHWDAPRLSEALPCSLREAARLLAALAEAGYLEPDPAPRAPAPWRQSVAGNALGQASAAPPVRRGTADRVFADFLARVREVNADDGFPLRVRAVWLFGSYAGDAPVVGDVNLVVDLAPRIADPGAFDRAMDGRRRLAGRRPRNASQRAAWPYDEILRYLRGRSRVLAFHEADDLALPGVKARKVFPGTPGE